MKVLEITCVFSEITVFGENLEIRVFFSPIESKKSSKKGVNGNGCLKC